MEWIRVNTDLEMDRKFRKLSGIGRSLLQFIWRLAKRHEGKIKIDDWDSDYFADMIGFFDCNKEIELQMQKMIDLGFVEKFEDTDDFFICNWDRYQIPKDRSNVDRQRRYRERQKTGCENSNEKVTLRNVTDNVTDALHNVSTVTNNSNAVHTVHDSTDSTVPTVQTDIIIDSPKAEITPTEKSKKKKRKSKYADIDGRPVWESYSNAYERKYGTKPVRNAAQSTKCCELVVRLGVSDAPLVAEYYLSSRNSWYATKGHSLGALLVDCEKVRTEWATGNQITQSQAREDDRLQSVGDGWAQTIAERESKENGN